MHKTTNHVFSQFIRLQPWAFSLSLAGLLALGSCTPPAKNNLSPSQVASPDIKHAPYLLKPSAQGSKTYSGLSPEIEASLRQKYGPFVKIGMEGQLRNYLASKIGNTPFLLTQPDFRIQDAPSGDNFTQCQGTIGSGDNEISYLGIGSLRDMGISFCPDYTEFVGYSSIESCYSSGGIPIYEDMHICEKQDLEDGEICFKTKFQGVLHECRRNDSNHDPNDPSNGCDPRGINCETDLPDFFLLAHHGNRPLNRATAPGDSPTQQVTLSPEDVNDAFDWTRLTIRDNQSQGWQLQISNANGKLLKEESGTGSTFVEWDGSNPAGEKVANGIYTARLTSPALPGTQIERMIRIDNNPPLVSNIRVQENPSTGFFSVKAKLKEAGNGAFQSGINPDTIQIFFDYFSTDQGFGKSYDAATGEYSVQFSNLAQYQQARQLSQQSGYDFPFELRVSDYAGNETSNRGSGPDGPLRIQVLDPYFSPNADGVKDNLNFKVIAETSEPYLVAIKRNGIAVKTWTGLTGEQNLSWNGNFMFTDRLQADGSYRIVAMTERQKDRVRDAQMVVLDTVGPEFKKLYAKKASGNVQITAKVTDKHAGIDESQAPLPIQPQLLNSTTTG
ncbi:MAG: hypothetical protein IV090_19075 [Candidatus Sericytochromatia bacterium]|nr:hypothetical protein [Candidatus Sericytochromatia bacterium]